ncbi:serpin-ZX-like [Raphanus sativus]|uniref:Serpin-ZX-like n=1 Tax=Raphanus sativus TaxID=3726 RepID=A0A6J0NEE4_RAPSA|nr:serpin-ZX-like [Raphanus sativus]
MDLRKSVGKQNELALRVAKHVIATTPGAKTSNLVFSPASINVVLSFLAAKSGGSTADHILSLLQASSTNELNTVSSKIITDILADSTRSGGPTISTANGVWTEKTVPVEPSFRNLIENSYKAAFNLVDFRTKADEVVEEVNEWVKNQTRGLITDILGSVPPQTDVIFANALFFHGRWDEEFDPSLTRDYGFHRLDGPKLRVPFMTAYDSYKHRLEVYQGFKVLELPYRGGGSNDNRYFSMLICLPDEKNGLHAMLERVASCLGFLSGEGDIRGEDADVGVVKIPKFKFGFDLDVSEALQGLGLETPLEKIAHKACVEVDEVGTKAAAATAVRCCAGLTMPRRKKYDFVADHPFLFLVKEYTSGLVLFLGQVLDPSMH